MKNTSSSLPFLGAFTLILLSIFNPSMLAKAEVNRSTFVHDTCNRFQYKQLYKLCIPEIDSDPREDLKSNLTGILIIFVNHSISNFNDNIAFLKKEIKSGKLIGKTKEMYDSCLDDFKRGNNALQEGMHILLTQKGIDVYMLPTMNVASYVSDCVDYYEGVPISREWQSRYNTSWNLSLLILTTSNLIKCNRDIACIP